jgi:hypothetical protein
VNDRPDVTEMIVPIENIRCSPKVGEIVTFSYEVGARRSQPSDLKVYRIRKDISWDDVLRNFSSENKPLDLGSTCLISLRWNIS